MARAALRVPLLDLVAQHAPLRAELEAAMARVLDSGHFIGGPELTAFEDELGSYCGAANAIGLSSGTDALLVALWALGVGPGDEVVTTPFSFFATAGAISRLGARPVFADVDEHKNLDPAAVAACLSPRTRAIVPVSLFGRRPDIAALAAAAPGLPIVEDAAQAISAPGVGSDRAVRAFTLSFFPSKNLGALGDAGALLCHDGELADRVRLLRSHGARPKYHHLVVGANFRLDALQAACLRVKLRHLSRWTAARRDNALRLAAALDGVPGLRLPADAPGHVWHHFVVEAGPRRDALRAFLAAEGVETEVYYPEPLHLQPCFADLGYRPGSLPRAEAAAASVLALPIHPELDDAQLGHVAASVRAFFANSP